VWKLGLRPSANLARPKGGQGNFGVGKDAAKFFGRQREEQEKWLHDGHRRFEPIAAFAGTVRAQVSGGGACSSSSCVCVFRLRWFLLLLLLLLLLLFLA
jgi:hypothetical protein